MRLSEKEMDYEAEIIKGDSQWQLPDHRSLYISREAEQIRSHVQEKEEEPLSENEDLIVVDSEKKVYLQRKLPELPIVLRMDHSLIIAQKNQISTEIHIPLIPALFLKSSKGRMNLLTQFPLSSLSKTWFGDPVSGEEAYSMNITIGDMENEKTEDNPWFARCPLTIRNHSPELLSFQRLILRVPYYSLFTFQNRFYTNRITVSFRGMEQDSQVKIGTEKDFPENYRLYSEPQKKKELMGLKKSFYFIKSLTTF